MKIIQQTYIIKAPLEKVWKALTDPKIIEKWGGGPAIMDNKEGTKFTLWGGDIFGKNISVVPEKKLQQEWYAGEWDEPSIVLFTLTSNGDTTTVDLLHDNIPDSEATEIESGWKDYYMGPLKDLLEQ